MTPGPRLRTEVFFCNEPNARPDMKANPRERYASEGRMYSHPTPHPRNPDTFPYESLQKVGKGGMGVVYQAFEPSLQRRVAIKVMRTDFLEDLAPAVARDAVKRFVQEARAAASLTHPGVTTIYRVGKKGGVPYIAMEWLEGDTLEKVLEREVLLTVHQAAESALALLDTLAAAHASGIVHRDVKPANLMLLDDGRLKVTDFGIARVRGSRQVQTQVGMVLGTPLYAAPEQISGKPVDARADLYSVGVILFEMLAGRRPFDAPDMLSLLNAVLNDAPDSPRRFNSEIPPALEAVILRALRKSPLERFGSAEEMAAAIREAVPSATTSGVYSTTLSSDALAIPIGLETDGLSLVAPTHVGTGHSPISLMADWIQSWPARQLGLQNARQLLDQALERPLHADAFAGVIRLGDTFIMAFDGLVLGAFNPNTGVMGDVLIDTLAEELPAALYPVPKSLGSGQIMRHIASTFLEGASRHANLSSSFVDIVQLSERLQREGFDGVMRFEHQRELGFVFFEEGVPTFHLFSHGWPVDPRREPWQEWIASFDVTVHVDGLATRLLNVSYRRELGDFGFEVMPPRAEEKGLARLSSSLRGSKAHQRQVLPLNERNSTRGNSTLAVIYSSDPVHRIQRWLLDELPTYFAERKLTKRWKYLADWIELIRLIRWHHTLPRPQTQKSDFFDLVSMDEDNKVLHLVHRVSHGTRASIDDFVLRVHEAKTARIKTGDVGGAILIAPRFDEDALEHYAHLTAREERSGKTAWFFNLQDSFTQYGGFVRIGARRGYHLLLVAETEDGFVPIIPD